MRKVEFKAYVIFNEDECNYGNDMMGSIEHELYNLDGVRQWGFTEISNEEIEFDDSDWND